MSHSPPSIPVDELIRNGQLYIGDGYRAKNSELALQGIPFARAGNIDHGFDFSEADHFPERDLMKVGEKLSRPGDVVLTTKGTVGRFAFVKEDTPRFVYSPQLSFWRSLDSKGINPRFLFCWLRSPEFFEQAEAVKAQTDMADYVSLTDQRLMKISLPRIGEQERIASVVGTLDDAIDAGAASSQQWGRLSAVVFEQWIEDNEGNKEERRVQALIDANVLYVSDGYRAKNSELSVVGLPFARAGNLNDGFNFAEADVLGPEGVEAAGDKLARDFDCVFTSKGSVGRIALVRPGTPRFVYSPQLCFWRSLDHRRLHPLVLHEWMRGREFREQVDALKGQTDMADYVNLKDQRSMTVTLPWSVPHDSVGRLLEPIMDVVDSENALTRTLISLRDAILEGIFTGELGVRDAEALVAEVA